MEFVRLGVFARFVLFEQEIRRHRNQSERSLPTKIKQDKIAHTAVIVMNI